MSFLLPSLLAGIGTVLLVYDLGRRLWNREAGLWAALVLLFTVQFTLQARLAQIDATLCFWVTLSLYGLLRHLLLRSGWGWYALGAFAAGLGVITKGVGFPAAAGVAAVRLGALAQVAPARPVAQQDALDVGAPRVPHRHWIVAGANAHRRRAER